MKIILIILVLCLLAGCSVIYVEVAGNLDCGNIDVNKQQDINPATEAHVSVIPE